MSSSLRQRHNQHINSETHINELNTVNNTYIINDPKSKFFFNKIALWSTLIGVIFYLSSRADSVASVQNNNNNNNLKLVTVYPWPMAATIHHIEGQTEILISKDNREAVEAIRTTIVMANSLRSRRRYKSILLRFTNFIASCLGGQDSDKSDGDVELESYGEAKIRQYLHEHGEKCSGDNQDRSYHRYGELVDSIMSAGDDDERINLLWDDAISVFTWCQFANEDARGYITYGTFLKTQQVLEESRIKGVGIIGPDTVLTNGMHYSELFVIPSQKNEDLLMEILHSYFSASSPRDSLSDSPKPLLFGIHDRDLDQWTLERWIHTDGGRDGDWLLLK